MYREFFVLVTDEFYGVFEIEAKRYPSIFKENMDCVKCMEEANIQEYLFKKVGRNSLAKHNYKWYLCLGYVYRR